MVVCIGIGVTTQQRVPVHGWVRGDARCGDHGRSVDNVEGVLVGISVVDAIVGGDHTYNFLSADEAAGEGWAGSGSGAVNVPIDCGEVEIKIRVHIGVGAIEGVTGSSAALCCDRHVANGGSGVRDDYVRSHEGSTRGCVPVPRSALRRDDVAFYEGGTVQLGASPRRHSVDEPFDAAAFCVPVGVRPARGLYR